MTFLHRHDDERSTPGGSPGDPEVTLSSLADEMNRLRRTVLRQGHAQELFQARVEEAIARLPERTGTADAGEGGASVRSGRAAGSAGSGGPGGLGEPQVHALLELDGALLHLRRLAGEEAPPAPGGPRPEDLARSLREGLSLLQIRVRNLQHSMGLEAIPAAGRPFDDRWHKACGVVERWDLPDRAVVEEILPGYRMGGRVVRPAQVVVNRRPDTKDEPRASEAASRATDDGPRAPSGQDEGDDV